MNPAANQTMQCMEIWGGNQLVDTSVAMPGLDAWVYSKPYGQSDAGGGDIHYVSSCATGRVTRLLVADVSGHGEDVCNVAGTLRSLMRRYVNYIDQTEFVSAMNRKFVTLSAANCFATAVVTTFFAPTNSLSLCNAGHPPPLMYHARTGVWDFLDLDVADAADAEPANIPLGVLDVRYEQVDVTLEAGDLVMCYTDSLVESRRATGELIGQQGLLDIVRGLGETDPAKVTPAVLARIAEMREGNLDDDDVTVLLFRATGDGVTPGWKERLLAPVRVAGGVLASLQSGGGPAPLPEMTLANIGGVFVDALNRSRPKPAPRHGRPGDAHPASGPLPR